MTTPSPTRTVTDHPFNHTPHRTLIALTIPVTLSLLAEPITGMVDTAFVKELGSVPLAALGVGTTALSSLFWVFNFLGIGTQTTVAQALGQNEHDRASRMTGLAVIMALVCGLAVIALVLFAAPAISHALGADEDVLPDAVVYLRTRMIGGPAVIITLVALGALRGMQRMKAALWIAGGVNLLNIMLDGPLIFGIGGGEGLGVAGAALASAISQWIGALWALWMVNRALGIQWNINLADLRDLLSIGGDLFLRTSFLMIFLLLSTRVATQIGAEAGAAHQAIRTVWMFFSFMMEGLASTAQSLIGYFLGAQQKDTARRVAVFSLYWGVGVGVALLGVMLAAASLVEALFIPDDAITAFHEAWWIAALVQPFAALSFVTDGIHWGTGDYRFMRNAMFISMAIGCTMLLLINPKASGAFALVWVAMLVFLGARGSLGVARVWPGFGQSPLRPNPTTT